MNNPPTVVAFGELLLRLDTPTHRRFVQADELGVSFTGGEANAAVALSQWGIPSRIVSRVPSHEIGEACLNHFRRYGVDTNHVVRGGERLGLFFVETGAPGRPPRVIYDRDHSAFRTLSPSDFDWDRILNGAGWLHVTGTAPAVGEPAREALREAMAAAQIAEHSDQLRLQLSQCPLEHRRSGRRPARIRGRRRRVPGERVRCPQLPRRDVDRTRLPAGTA